MAVSKDDILDSLALLISLKVKTKTSYLSSDILTDDKKIPMKIAYPFINKSALVKKDEHYGIINEKGLFIITPKYKRVSIPSYEKHMVVFDDTFTYDMLQGKEYLGDFSLMYPGRHNLENALGAIAVCHTYGLTPDEISRLGLFLAFQYQILVF